MADYYRFRKIPTDTLTVQTARYFTLYTSDIRSQDNTYLLSFWDNPEEDIYTFENGESI